jgi:osmotically inducible protein OsmC
MASEPKVLYTARVHTTGGREGGASRSDDGRLDLRISPPGPRSDGTNPEQLFAAGWSNCFLSAMKIVAQKMRVKVLGELAVDTEIDLLLVGGEYSLRARLDVHLPGVEPEVAKAIVDAAHHTCPYSKAIHGNVEVTTRIFGESASPVMTQ